MPRTSVGLALLSLFASSCGSCESLEGAGQNAEASSVVPQCSEPRYGHRVLEDLYRVEAATGEPAILTTETDAVLAVSDRLLAALDRARETDLSAVPASAAVVSQGDAWGAASRLRARGIESSESDALIGALTDLAVSLSATDPRRGDMSPPPRALGLLTADAGWRELDSEHATLMHERAFGMRRAFRIFVRGDHEARALVSQLVAWDPDGAPYLSEVVGEIELLELDADGPTRARVFHLDRGALGCGDVRLTEETELRRIPDLGADSFLVDLPAPEPLSTMPCARCHEDADAFSLPTERTAVADRLGRLLLRLVAPDEAKALVPGALPSAQ